MTGERAHWLTAALDRHKSPQAPTGPSSSIQPGDIRRLDPMDFEAAPSRLALITDVDAVTGCASVTLLSPETENGSNLDRFVGTDLTGLPYDLIALSDVSGPAWFVQLHHRVASLDVTLDELPAAGVALRDDKDARWTWKEDELDQLIQLTSECRLQLIDGEAITIADPAALDLDVVDVIDHLRASQAFTRLLEQEKVLLPAEGLQQLDVPTVHPAHDSIQALRFTAYRHKEQLLPASHPSDTGSPLRTFDDDPLQRALASLTGRLADSTRCIRVASLAFLWSPVQDDDPHVRELLISGRRHQILIAPLDAPEDICA
ncbi:hypothetical protein [Nocardioides sp. MH1]|uniref:hypothetical protein n=1 Tax=Nocardioides sp. MH1 TaxID=3242490 RepID=UPI003522D352